MFGGLASYSLLIRQGPARRRAPGHTVHRVRRSSGFAGELQMLTLFGGPYGLGTDLVTGQRCLPFSTPDFAASDDGEALEAASGYVGLPHDERYNILGDLTLVSRALARNDTHTFISKAGGGTNGSGGGAAINPFYFSPFPGNKLYLVRASFTYTAWNSVVGGRVTDRLATYGVTSPADNSEPVFYFDGLPSAGQIPFGSAGSGPPWGNTDPVYLAEQGNGLHAMDVAASRIWSADEMARVADEPYRLVEETPIYHFMRRMGGTRRPFIFRH